MVNFAMTKTVQWDKKPSWKASKGMGDREEGTKVTGDFLLLAFLATIQKGNMGYDQYTVPDVL